jgi:hypothetical protein
MLGLLAEPSVFYLQLWPASVDSGAFAFHRDAFLASEPAQLDEFYHADGYNICTAPTPAG